MDVVIISKYEEYISKNKIEVSNRQTNFDDNFPLENMLHEIVAEGNLFGIFELRRLSKHDAYYERYKDNSRFPTRYYRLESTDSDRCVNCYFLRNDEEDTMDLLSISGIDEILRTDIDFNFLLKAVTRPIYGRFSARGTICTALIPVENGWDYMLECDGGSGEIHHVGQGDGYIGFQMLEYIGTNP